jgi:hypothetical protein
MVKVIRAYDRYYNIHSFSIVADDKKFEYVFENSAAQIFNPKKRNKMIMGMISKDRKVDVDVLLSFASINLSAFRFASAFEESNFRTAVVSERTALRRAREESYDADMRPGMDSETIDDVNQVFADYPDLYDQLSSDDPNEKITSKGLIELAFAVLGPIDPNGPYGHIVKYLDEMEEKKSDEPVTAAADSDSCPPATQDLDLNLKNRQNAIDNVGYGPLNPQEPNEEFWQKKAERWSVSIEDAKKSTCGNCAAFIVTSKMKNCIAQGLAQGDQNAEDSFDVVVQGELGYCEALDFKCAASRTCDAWIVGGPVTDETGKEQA